MIVYHVVYVFDDECWKCGEKIKLAFIKTIPIEPVREFGDSGLELIKDKPYANVKKVYSKTLEREVWGNVCQKCGAYQGNFFLFSKWAEANYSDETKIVDVIENFVRGEICPLCGREAERLVVHHISYDPPETIDICQACHVKIHKRNGFLDYAKKEPS